MIIHKNIKGTNKPMELELEKIKSYRRYTLYQVYDITNGDRVPLYRECFTNLELRKIVVNGSELNDDINYVMLDSELNRNINSQDSEEETFNYLLADLLEV